MQFKFKDELLAMIRSKRIMFMTVDANVAGNAGPGVQTEDFAQWIRANQAKLTPELRPHDFMVFGGPVDTRP